MHRLDASLYPTLGACASSQPSHVSGLGDGLINRTHAVEGFLLGHLTMLQFQPRVDNCSLGTGIGHVLNTHHNPTERVLITVLNGLNQRL